MFVHYCDIIIFIHKFLHSQEFFICIHALGKNFWSIFDKCCKDRFRFVKIVLNLFRLTCLTVMWYIFKPESCKHFMQIESLSAFLCPTMFFGNLLSQSFHLLAIFLIFFIKINFIRCVFNCVHMSSWLNPVDMKIDILIFSHLLTD